MYSKINVVCFGGGTGLPSLLSGLKDNPWLNISAVVNMFDTGGSSGELKDKFGILPPGDVLKCLLALSEEEQLVRKIFQKRISNHSFPGHTGGNILLLGLEKVYGDYMQALNAFGQVLSVKGRVLPVTLSKSDLVAEYVDGSIHKGETSVDLAIHEGKQIKGLKLDPEVPASSMVIEAITNADVICVGPGSFYTSVLPNFLPLHVSDSIKESRAKIIFIPNLLTEGKGMQGLFLEHIVNQLEFYLGKTVDYIILNSQVPSEEVMIRYAIENKYRIVPEDIQNKDKRIIIAPLWLGELARHDSKRLAYLVTDLINGYR